MIKVAALTGGRFIPSSRFRIRQHIQPLTEHGILVREYCPAIDKSRTVYPLTGGKRIREVPLIYPLFIALEVAKFTALFPGVLGSWCNDITWLERGLYDGFPTIEKALKKPLILDVDDAVWHAKPYGEAQMKHTAQWADQIVVGNNYLADWFGKFNKNISVVPTALDTDIFYPSVNNEKNFFTVGWTGTSGNFNYLYSLNNAIKRFFEYAKNARMLIVADEFPSGLDLPRDRLDYVKWSEDNEAELVKTMDVGLMPLEDSNWTRGKCSFKMLQYMACGLPVVVSPVGMNCEILAKGNIGFAASREGDWLDALIFLYEDGNQRSVMGREGRIIVEREYSQKIVSGELATIMRKVL